MANAQGLRSIAAGRERLAPGENRPRHRHLEAYALVVVAGAFEQTSYAGRVIARQGDMLVQPTLDCHANRLISAGAEILRLAWPRVTGLGGVHRLDDLDAVVYAAEKDPTEASALARTSVARSPALLGGELRDWPDILAADLAHGRAPRLAVWAQAHGLARETVARGFSRAFGVAPARFRSEIRAREAWLCVIGTREPLASIAAALGFADQPHMTRAVAALTGAPPSAWRRRCRAAATPA